MKKAILILLLCAIAQYSNSQTSAVYSFGDSVKSCVGDAGLIDVDGNYVMMGRRSGSGNQYAKFDANHAMIWSFITPNNFAVQGWRMFQTANKDYIGVLSTGTGAVIIRISASGNIVWNRSIGQITSLRDGFEDANGDLYFAGGWTNRNIVIRLDANGNEIWAKKITNGNNFHQGVAINATADGNIMIGGVTQSATSAPVGLTLSKVTKSGQILWAYTYTTSTLSLTPSDMEISSLDQSIIMAGHSYSNVGTYDINTTEAIVAKIDSSGNLMSFKSLGNTKEDKFTAITQVPYPNNPLFVLSGFSKIPTGATKLLLSSVDNNGDFVTTKTYGDNHGNGFFFDQINYDPTHGLNVMGTGSGFYVTNASEYQFARFDTSLTLPCKAFTRNLVQSSTNLNRVGTFAISNHTLSYDTTAFTKIVDSLTAFNSCTGDTINNLPVAVQHFDKADVKLYPNPVQGTLSIDFGTSKLAALFVRAMSGNIIYAAKNETAFVQIKTQEWASGIYFVDVRMMNGQRLVRKLLVR